MGTAHTEQCDSLQNALVNAPKADCRLWYYPWHQSLGPRLAWCIQHVKDSQTQFQWHECVFVSLARRSARSELENGSLGAASSLMTAALDFYEAASHLNPTDIKLMVSNVD